MHDLYLSFPGARREDHWLITDSAARISRLKAVAPQLADRAVLLPLSASGFPPGIEAVRVEDVSQVDSLRVLASATGLRFLSIPSGLASGLLDLPLPTSLSVLHLAGKEIARLPGGLQLPGITRLIGDRVRFDPGQFQSLRHLDIRYERPLRPVLGRINRLATLNLRSVSDPDMLADVRPDGLVFLGLRGGTSSVIGALSRSHPGLQQLWLQDLKGTIDFGDLEGLSALQELTVGYCRDVTGLDVLSRLRRLNAIHFFGCGEIGIDRLAAPLKEVLQTVRIDGTS